MRETNNETKGQFPRGCEPRLRDYDCDRNRNVEHGGFGDLKGQPALGPVLSQGEMSQLIHFQELHFRATRFGQQLERSRTQKHANCLLPLPPRLNLQGALSTRNITPAVRPPFQPTLQLICNLRHEETL